MMNGVPGICMQTTEPISINQRLNPIEVQTFNERLWQLPGADLLQPIKEGFLSSV
jgi:hypothetical protein